MSKEVIPLNQIQNLDAVAASLSTLLTLESNSDVAREFPRTVAFYTGDHDRVTRNLVDSGDRFAEGKCESFVIFTAKTAVGMAQVTRNGYALPDIDPDWPGIDYFICRPWRGQGLGRLALERLLVSVTENFGGCAWTAVKKENTASRQLVLSAGFTPSDPSATADTASYLYKAINTNN